MFIAILCITFLSALFISGIVGYVASAKKSFNTTANAVNFYQENFDFSYNSLAKGIDEKVMKNISGVISPNADNYTKSYQALINILNGDNPISHDLGSKYHTKTDIEKIAGNDLKFTEYNFTLGIDLEYLNGSNISNNSKAVISPNTVNNIYKKDSKYVFKQDETPIYNKPYYLDKNNKLHVEDISNTLSDNQCYVSETWLKSSKLNIGDHINLTSKENDIPKIHDFEIIGVADSLNQISPVDGSDIAVFGVPKSIPNIFVNRNIYKQFENSSNSYNSLWDFYWEFSINNHFQTLNKKQYAAFDNYLRNLFLDNHINTPNNIHVKTITSKRTFMGEWNDTLTLTTLPFFLWTKLVDIYLYIGIVLSAIFWILAIIILFLTLKRIISINQNRLATLKSLGYSAHTLSMGMLIYPLLISITSIILGLAIGYGLQYFLNHIYSQSYNFPMHLTFSPFIIIFLFGFLFLATNIISYAYNYRQMSKSIMVQFSTSKLKTPKMIMALKPLLQRVSFNWKFTFLFALKNSGKIAGSFFIMALSFCLLVVSIVALNTSLNIGLAINRGYSYNVSGITTDNTSPIICDNPHYTSGYHDFYLVNNLNLDYSDNSDRLIKLGEIKANFINLKDADAAYEQNIASKIWTNTKNLAHIFSMYSNPANKTTKSGVNLTLGNSFIGYSAEEINSFKSPNYYFATKNSGTVEDWKKFREALVKVVDKDTTVDKTTRDNFLANIDQILNIVDFKSFNSYGFGFKNISFTNETFGNYYRLGNLNLYDNNGSPINLNGANNSLFNLGIDTFLDTPYQKYLFSYNSQYFNDLFNQYPAIDMPSKDDQFALFNTSHPITIPIIVNRTFSTSMYLDINKPIQDNYYFQYSNHTEGDNPINIDIKFKIIKVYDSYGPNMVWTSKEFANILDYFNFYRNTGKLSNKPFIRNVSSVFFVNNLYYYNIGFNPFLRNNSFDYYTDGDHQWHGDITYYNFPDDSNIFYSLGFGNFINIIDVIFVIIALFAILLSLSSIYIFFNIIITDDLAIFAAMNILGYGWTFSLKQVIKIYLTLTAIIIAIFMPLIIIAIEKFDTIFRSIAPIDINIYYNSFVFVFSALLMLIILISNFLIVRKFLKGQKAIKILASE